MIPSIETALQRTGDNNILPEVKEAKIRQLALELPKRTKKFRFSISAIAEELGVDYKTAQNMLKEAVKIWQRDNMEEVELQKEWLRHRIDEADRLPPNCERVSQIRFMLELFDRLNLLNKLSPAMYSPDDSGEMQFILIGRMGKNTQKHFEEKGELKIIEQNAVTTDTTEDGSEGEPT